VLINTIFASYLETGSVAALELANRLNIIIVGIFVFAITNYIFPSLSRYSGGKNDTAFAGVMKSSLASMVIIIAPIAAGIMLLSEEIVVILYARGQFDGKSVVQTATALFFYSIGMLAYGTNEVLSKCFYASKDGKTPMIATIFGIISVIVLAFVFTNILHLGIGGLALAASISAIAVAVVLIYKMNKNTYNLINKNTFIFVLKITAAVVITVIAAVIAKRLTIQFNEWITTIVSAAVALPVYVISLYLFKIRRYFGGIKSNG
jgi:putative peptidoglycan lipid II flippase